MNMPSAMSAPGTTALLDGLKMPGHSFLSSKTTVPSFPEPVRNNGAHIVDTSSVSGPLITQFQEAAKRMMQAEGGADGDEKAVQLEFDFFFESRSEELTLFRETMRSTADALSDPLRESLLYTSKTLAMRFSMSAKISGEALAGFSEAAKEAQREKMLEFLDRFLKVAEKLLQGPDAWINEFMSAFAGNATDDKSTRLNALMDAVLQSFFEAAKGLSALQSGNGQSARFAGVQLEFSFSFSMSAETVAIESALQEADPLVFDLTGNGFHLTSHADGARFDLLGDGRQVNTAFVTGGDAFLALDLNKDGIINSGRELFGDQNGARNGFDELRKYDSNGDGVINHLDDVFDSLLLWRDNGDGISERHELFSLRDFGIAEIRLDYKNVNKAVSGGNRITEIAAFKYDDGRYGRVADVQLNYLA